MGKEAESSPIDKIIYFNPNDYTDDIRNSNLHFVALQKIGIVIDIKLPTYYILHELGHIITINKYKRPLLKLHNYSRQCRTLRFGFPLHRNEQKLLNDYKKLDLERDADTFAYELLLSDHDSIVELENKIIEILRKEKNEKSFY